MEKAIEVCVGDLGLKRTSGSQPLQDDLPLLLLGRELQDCLSFHEGVQYSLFPISPLVDHETMLLQIAARGPDKVVSGTAPYTYCHRTHIYESQQLLQYRIQER